MVILLTPAKSLNFSRTIAKNASSPKFLNEASTVMSTLRQKNPEELAALLSVSMEIAEENWHRNQHWSGNAHVGQTASALSAFNGNVYHAMQSWTFTKRDLNWAQERLCIVSGLYGLLRPLDAIEPYRLDMGTKLSVDIKENLYRFWEDKIAEELEKKLTIDAGTVKTPLVVSLLSLEYAKAVNLENIPARVVSPRFLAEKNNEIKHLGFPAKRGRGLMCRFIIQNRIKTYNKLLEFSEDGYAWSKDLSTRESPVFIRKEKHDI